MCVLWLERPLAHRSPLYLHADYGVHVASTMMNAAPASALCFSVCTTNASAPLRRRTGPTAFEEKKTQDAR